MAAAQVRAFLETLHQAQAFGTRRVQDAFFVVCDQRSDFHLVIGFAATRKAGFHSFRIVHGATGSKVEPVSLNRWSGAQYSPAEIDWVESLARSLSD